MTIRKHYSKTHFSHSLAYIEKNDIRITMDFMQYDTLDFIQYDEIKYELEHLDKTLIHFVFVFVPSQTLVKFWGKANESIFRITIDRYIYSHVDMTKTKLPLNNPFLKFRNDLYNALQLNHENHIIILPTYKGYLPKASPLNFFHHEHYKPERLSLKETNLKCIDSLYMSISLIMERQNDRLNQPNRYPKDVGKKVSSSSPRLENAPKLQVPSAIDTSKIDSHTNEYSPVISNSIKHLYDKLLSKQLQVKLLNKGYAIPISSKRLVSRTVLESSTNLFFKEFKLYIEATSCLDYYYLSSSDLQEPDDVLAYVSYDDDGLKIDLQIHRMRDYFTIDILEGSGILEGLGIIAGFSLNVFIKIHVDSGNFIGKKIPGPKMLQQITTLGPKPLPPQERLKPMSPKHNNHNNVGGNKLPESLENPKKASSIANDFPGASNNIDKPCSENKVPSTLPEASVKEVSTDIKTSFMGAYLAAPLPLSKAIALIATQSNQTFMDKTDFYQKLVGKELQVELLHKGRVIPISRKRLIARTFNNIEEEFKLDIEATYYLDSPYVPSCNLQETPHTLAHLSYGNRGLRINLQTPIVPNSFSIDIGLFSLNNLSDALKDKGKYKIDRFSLKILIEIVEQVTNETPKKPSTSISIKKKTGKLLPKPFISDETDE